MPLAGEIIVAGQVPGERIATSILVVASAAITTEAQAMSVTAALVNGRTYKVTAAFLAGISVATDIFVSRIRENTVAGNALQFGRFAPGLTNSGFHDLIEAEFTAVATGDKTFSFTLQRSTGTGTITVQGGAANPAYLYVDYIRG